MRWRVEWGVLWALACTDGVQQVRPVACDPIADQGCGAGMHCRVVEGGALACLIADEPGDTCSPGNCPAGEACSVVEGRLACRVVCALAEPAGCSDGTCAYGLGDSEWGVCVRGCILGECPPDSTCAPVVAAPHPICVATGPGMQDASCTATRCARGLGCLLREDEPQCTELCVPGAGCTNGMCDGVIRQSPELGFCN